MSSPVSTFVKRSRFQEVLRNFHARFPAEERSLTGIFSAGKMLHSSTFGQGTYSAIVVRNGELVHELGGKSFYTSQTRSQVMGAVVGIGASPTDEPCPLFAANKLIPRVIGQDVMRAKETRWGKKRRLIGSKRKHYFNMDLLKQLDVELEQRPHFTVEKLRLRDAEQRFWMDYVTFLSKAAIIECDPRMDGVDEDDKKAFDAAL